MGSLELMAISAASGHFRPLQLHLDISDYFFSFSGLEWILAFLQRCQIVLAWISTHTFFSFHFHINENVQYSWIQGTSPGRSMEWRVSIWVVTKKDYSHVFCSFTWSLVDFSHRVFFFNLDHYNCLSVIQECKNLISQCVTSVSPHPQGWVILLQEKIKLTWFLLEKKVSATFLFPTFALMFTGSQLSGN